MESLHQLRLLRVQSGWRTEKSVSRFLCDQRKDQLEFQWEISKKEYSTILVYYLVPVVDIEHCPVLP